MDAPTIVALATSPFAVSDVDDDVAAVDTDADGSGDVGASNGAAGDGESDFAIFVLASRVRGAAATSVHRRRLRLPP